MTLASECYGKKVVEVIEVTIDCAGQLAGDETIDTIGTITQEADDDDAADLIISGKTKNAAILREQKKRSIAIGQGIQFFAAAGTAGATYRLGVSYTTSAGQTRVAEVMIEVE